MDDDRAGGDEPTTSADDRSATSAGAPSDATVPPAEILDLDHVYAALDHPRRRYLCYTLLEDDEWTLEELAAKVAAWEDGAPEREVTARRRENVYVSLYHAHVPKLVDLGVVAFDEGRETITPAEHAEQVLTALQGMGASLDANQETHARGETDA
ncbi:MAG: hypothetical protein ABEJ26_04660 [Halosimplex sp.]